MHCSYDKIYFDDDEEYFRIFNFQRSENVKKIVDIIQDKLGEQSRIIQLNGPKGIGKEYLLRAAAYEASALGYPTRVASMDLAGWNPDTGTLGTYLESLAARLSKDHAQRLTSIFDGSKINIDAALGSVSKIAWLPIGLELELPAKILIEAANRLWGGGASSVAHELNREPRQHLRWFLRHTTENQTVVLYFPGGEHSHTLIQKQILEDLPMFPGLVLAFANDVASAMADGTRQMPAGIDVLPYDTEELAILLAEKRGANTFPEDFFEAIHEVTAGYPGRLTIALMDLAQAELIYRDKDDVWVLEDAALNSQALAELFYDKGLYMPVRTLLDRLRTSGATGSAEDLERFLSIASLCGVYIPFDLICNYLKLTPERTDTLIDLLTDELNDSQGRPLLKYMAKNLADFGDLEIFRLENTILGAILRNRMGEKHLETEARQFYRSIKAVLRIDNRSIAAFYLSLGYYLSDDGRQETIQSELNWWIGQNEAEDLKSLLIQQCNKGLLNPELLWSLDKITDGRWPSWRSLAVLEAYGEQENGMPFDRRAIWFWRMGSCFYKEGRYSTALEHHQEALDIRNKVLPPDHPDVASSLNSIGVCLGSQGNYKEALEHHRKALAIREKAFPRDHRNVATDFANIGVCLGSQGNYKEALEYHRKALAIKEKVLPPDHPGIATTLGNIGVCLDDDKEALEYCRKALAIREKVLPPDHPDIATSLDNIGARLDDGTKRPLNTAARPWPSGKKSYRRIIRISRGA